MDSYYHPLIYGYHFAYIIGNMALYRETPSIGNIHVVIWYSDHQQVLNYTSYIIAQSGVLGHPLLSPHNDYGIHGVPPRG